MKRILMVMGTRPEAIKMAPVVKEFQRYPDNFLLNVCITAQHREMLDQVLSIFEIIPDFDLNIMKPGQDLYDVTARVMIGMRDVLNDFKPDVVLVHGDTTTSSITALASFYQQIPVGHVEAGLRTFNIYSPFPEEINRQITGRISTFHFAPTHLARQNLLNENVNPDSIIVTGNTVIDALFIALSKLDHDKTLLDQVRNNIISVGYTNLEQIEKGLKKLILVTGHRRENFGEGFINICNALKTIALSNPDFDIVYPVHLNPNVQQPVYHLLSEVSNIYLIPPIEYLPFIYLMELSYLVLTDSGGIQEEAPSLGKPVLVMRETTERPEAVEAGTVKLVGTNYKLIVNETQQLINNQESYLKMSKAHNPYGDGNAAKRIVQFLQQSL